MKTSDDAQIFAKELVSLWLQCENAKTSTTKEKYFQKCLELCQQKQAKLLQTCSEITLIKTHTSVYRRAIATEAGKLDDSVKGGYSYTDYPMAFWKINQTKRTEIDSKTKVIVGNKKKDAVRVPLECREKLLTLANDLLEVPVAKQPLIKKNSLIYKKALAIALLTGRRFYVEICRNAAFAILPEIEDFNRRIAFTGQAKGGQAKSEQVYYLPTYAENLDLLLENLEIIQNHIFSKPWYKADLSAREFQSHIKKDAEYALNVFQNVCRDYGFLITIKDLRALYMAFAYYDYRVLSAKHPDHDSYVGSIAGHDAQTESGETYYRVGMTEHYKSFIDARWDNF